jgi:beta-mannanase
MAWSPNDWLFGDSSDKYYPGDEYVDWVGVSSYPPYTSI